MQTTTFLYIILALFLSISGAFFQYFFKNKDKRKVNILLFILKTSSLFLLGLLLINPKITIIKTENIKPILSVLIDNSNSTAFFKQEKQVEKYVKKIQLNKEINDKFNVNYFSFGEKIRILDSVSFKEPQTNISQAIQSVNELYKNNLGTIILLSDGNQTIGNDYQFTTSKQTVNPLVIGDTTSYKDVRITQLNVNKYSYIKNKFPVEVLLHYKGSETIYTQFSIYLKGKKVFTKKVSFSPENNSATITTNLQAFKKGLHYYTASVKKLSNEKNLKNNTKNFSVEVISQQTKVLMITSFLHPDLSALKRSIESNKQRKVDLFLANKFKGKLTDYQLIILYQPTNKFKRYFEKQKSNYLLISGVKTDWNYLNSLQLGFTKKTIGQSENYTPIYNDKFATFYQKNIGFDYFPPIISQFGEITLQAENQILLYQNNNGIQTKSPLLATFEKGENKWAVLFGEGIWKWRATNYRKNNSFQEFDQFIGNLVQYLASNKKRNRLQVEAESLYPANSTVTIFAFYTDKNYIFDNRASLLLTLTDTKTKKKQIVPFSLVGNSYQVSIENLTSGIYNYQVSVEDAGIKKYGKLKITDYKIEEQFTNANSKKLEKLATRTGGKLYYFNQENSLLQNLISNKSYYTTQKSTNKEQNLIDWKWILIMLLILLSIEWFIRKYYGKI